MESASPGVLPFLCTAAAPSCYPLGRSPTPLCLRGAQDCDTAPDLLTCRQETVGHLLRMVTGEHQVLQVKSVGNCDQHGWQE